jgi:hypothetical protein
MRNIGQSRYSRTSGSNSFRCRLGFNKKRGKCAIIYPMLAVEEGNNKSTDGGQIAFHKRCASINYVPTFYI